MLVVRPTVERNWKSCVWFGLMKIFSSLRWDCRCRNSAGIRWIRRCDRDFSRAILIWSHLRISSSCSLKLRRRSLRTSNTPKRSLRIINAANLAKKVPSGLAILHKRPRRDAKYCKFCKKRSLRDKGSCRFYAEYKSGWSKRGGTTKKMIAVKPKMHVLATRLT